MTGAQPEDERIDESWAVSEGILDGKPILVRVRRNLRSMAQIPQCSHRLRVVWEYEPDNPSSMPSPADLEAFERCENLLVDVLEKDGHAILTHVMTCDGLRQWVFYASDLEEAVRRINSVLPHDPPYPIELTSELDAEWSEYLRTLRTLRL
jgi:hypothetical protein